VGEKKVVKKKKVRESGKTNNQPGLWGKKRSEMGQTLETAEKIKKTG